MPPIHLSTNFFFDAPGVYGKYDYTRTANPTRDLAAETIAELEGGCGAVVTSSGMSAIAVATRLLSAGDLLLAPRDCYGGSYRLFSAEANRGSYQVEFVDPWDRESLQLARELRPRMIWIETPSNPHLRITDIAAWSRLARETGAICVVDNTFLSPVNQRPLDHGADLVVHSTTKYLGGHEDATGGAVVGASDSEFFQRIRLIQNVYGAVPSPFDCWLTLRGIRTLHVRMPAHCANAGRIARFLHDHPNVAAVHYPGLLDHPGHDVATRQMADFGGMLSFQVVGGRDAAMRVAANVRLFVRATSLGGTQSLIEHRASIEGPDSTTPDDLLRVSVGLENADDLIADLGQALG